ncbi:MAG: hypothetical protein JO166_11145, partial [Deltaproteobacteria bacterium]|nr:hypothetical protein [Deltaproteobacteria bacterium]
SSIEQLRTGELERHRAWLASLAPDERARIELMTRSLVNKLLHRVLSGLRDSQDTAAERPYAAAIARRLLCSDLNVAEGIADISPDVSDLPDELNEAAGANISEQIPLAAPKRK